jgi:transcriptional regulator with XRE-family HTH domain
MSTPAPPKPPRFVRHIDRLINQSEKTQREIALAMGYERSNLISMFKQGITRVPLDKVPALAEALDVDPAELIVMWLSDYEPELLEVINSNVGMLLSGTERSWIAHLRKLFTGRLPPWDERIEAALAPLAPNEE